MAKNTPHLRIRIEPKLLARLEKSREKNRNTLTGEIVERLEESFRRDDTKDHLSEVAKLVVEQMKPELSYGHVVREKAVIDKLEELAARPDSQHEPDALRKEAAERRARLDEAIKKEEARIFHQIAFDHRKKDE